MKTPHANRGRTFETLIEMSNRFYESKGRAVIQKVPTPTTVIRRNAQVVGAFYPKQSTIDYLGCLQGGRAIAFEAKSVREKTRFDLANLHEHQIEFLQRFAALGGIAFLLLEMTAHQKVYLLPAAFVTRWWRAGKSGGRASIPYDDIATQALVVSQPGCPVDYLEAWGESDKDSSS